MFGLCCTLPAGQWLHVVVVHALYYAVVEGRKVRRCMWITLKLAGYDLITLLAQQDFYCFIQHGKPWIRDISVHIWVFSMRKAGIFKNAIILCVCVLLGGQPPVQCGMCSTSAFDAFPNCSTNWHLLSQHALRSLCKLSHPLDMSMCLLNLTLPCASLNFALPHPWDILWTLYFAN